ncbi:hypothetical protein F4802DRAFT_590813 [Xylaria palmicola]|nr:hypothetical protein F4802DRAFT_590813 [Xylaria palmicola]
MAGTSRSCTSCRQAKVGCDARKKPSNAPCTRCDRNQLECRFDKNFKRILTRKLTANLTNELHQLRMSRGVHDGDKLLPLEAPLREPESQSPPPRAPFFSTNIADPLPGFSTGNITVPRKTIIELIKYFGYQYHAHAHFIQPIESLSSFYTSSPLLFWTIVLVASHHHPEHSGLYAQLLSPCEELLKPFVNTAIQSIHEIHALLLLCLWPAPNRTESASPTWNYIGLAVGACMRLNLAKATPPNSIDIQLDAQGHHGRSPEASMQTRRLTWLACLAITTQEATFLGLLPPFSSRLHLKHSRKAMSEVKDLMLPGFTPKFAIYEMICDYSHVLEEADGFSAQIALVEAFDSSLDRIQQTYAAEWSTDVDVLLQYAKLNLNATALMRILIENSGNCSVDVQTLIIQGSEASSRLITDVKAMTSGVLLAGEGRQSSTTMMPICYPRFYFEVLFFAAVFIFRTAYMRPSTSHGAATEGLVEVYNIYRLFPRHLDLKSGSDVVQRLLHYAKSGELSYATSPLGGLVTTHRLGASFVWDTVARIGQLSSVVRCAGEAGNEHEDAQVSNHALTGPSVTTQNRTAYEPPEAIEVLPLPTNFDWGDIDLSFPIFDVFGLEAGEHIEW